MLNPILAWVAFNFVFIFWQFSLRVRSVRSKQVRMSYFRLFDNAGVDIPMPIVAGQRHLSNMFEIPVLFFVVAILAIVLQVETGLMITLAWGYVAARIAHALIHTLYNNIVHRMLCFWVGMLLLMAMWVHLAIAASSPARY